MQSAKGDFVQLQRRIYSLLAGDRLALAGCAIAGTCLATSIRHGGGNPQGRGGYSRDFSGGYGRESGGYGGGMRAGGGDGAQGYDRGMRGQTGGGGYAGLISSP